MESDKLKGRASDAMRAAHGKIRDAASVGGDGDVRIRPSRDGRAYRIMARSQRYILTLCASLIAPVALYPPFDWLTTMFYDQLHVLAMLAIGGVLAFCGGYLVAILMRLWPRALSLATMRGKLKADGRVYDASEIESVRIIRFRSYFGLMRMYQLMPVLMGATMGAPMAMARTSDALLMSAHNPLDTRTSYMQKQAIRANPLGAATVNDMRNGGFAVAALFIFLIFVAFVIAVIGAIVGMGKRATALQLRYRDGGKVKTRFLCSGLSDSAAKTIAAKIAETVGLSPDQVRLLEAPDAITRAS